MEDKILFNQMLFTRKQTIKLIKEIPDDFMDIIPESLNNSIRWNIGHIFTDQEIWLYERIKNSLKFPPFYREYFAYGSSPYTWNDYVPSKSELINHLEKQPYRIMKDFSRELDQHLVDPVLLGCNNTGQILLHTLYHEGLHVGVIQSINKILTKKI
ncbi:DinB family protein [Priestia megaterium]|uniref:DinB family protein n=1 Tax=Priestia megaterium TaxID=1404 RepID=UPI0031FD6588